MNPLTKTMLKIFAQQVAALIKFAGAATATMFLAAGLSGCALTEPNINWTTYEEVDGAPKIEQYVETYWGGSSTAAVNVTVDFKNAESGDEWTVTFTSDEATTPEGQTEQASLFWDAMKVAFGVAFGKGL